MPSLYWCRLLLGGAACTAFWTSLSFAQPDSSALRALLQRADSTSPALAEARVELASARAAYTSARGMPNPTLFLESEELDGDGGSVRERTVGMRQNIGFLWTQPSRWNSAKSAYEAAQASYEERRRELHAEIMYSALRYSQLRSQRSFMDSLSVVGSRLVETAAARLRVGDISIYESERMQLEQVDLFSRHAALVQEEQAEAVRFVELSGLPAGELDGIAGVPAVASPFPDEAAALSYARENRPRLRELELAARSARQSVTAARLGMLPDLSVGIGRKRVEPEETGLYWEAELEIPIFNQRRSAANLARTEAAAARLRSESSRRAAEQEVISVFRRWQEAQRWPVPDVNPVDRARRNLQLAVTLYLNGESGNWELIDALRTSIDALTAAHSLTFTRTQAAIELRRVTGYTLLED